MLEVIRKVLGDKPKKNGVETRNEEDEAHIALCVLLLEAAHADGQCSGDEMEHIVSTLTVQAGVPRAELEALLDAAYQRREDSVDLFKFTRYLNQNYTKEQKLEVMESVWRVILTDGRLEAHEDHFAHKLANLLRLTHKEMIDTKIKARQDME